MLQTTLCRIEQSIHENEALPEVRKSELLDLIAQLRVEIGELGEAHREDAGSIVSYAETSIREAVKSSPDSELLRHSIDGLTLSVRRFEVSHPTLIGIINNIGQVLGNIGI